jgi:hypothetical protein
MTNARAMALQQVERWRPSLRLYRVVFGITAKESRPDSVELMSRCWRSASADLADGYIWQARIVPDELQNIAVNWRCGIEVPRYCAPAGRVRAH